MTLETKLLVAAIVLDVLWVASIGYVAHDTARRGARRLRWVLVAVVGGPAGLVYWLCVRRGYVTTSQRSVPR